MQSVTGKLNVQCRACPNEHRHVGLVVKVFNIPINVIETSVISDVRAVVKGGHHGQAEEAQAQGTVDDVIDVFVHCPPALSHQPLTTKVPQAQQTRAKPAPYENGCTKLGYAHKRKAIHHKHADTHKREEHVCVPLRPSLVAAVFAALAKLIARIALDAHSVVVKHGKHGKQQETQNKGDQNRRHGALWGLVERQCGRLVLNGRVLGANGREVLGAPVGVRRARGNVRCDRLLLLGIVGLGTLDVELFLVVVVLNKPSVVVVDIAPRGVGGLVLVAHVHQKPRARNLGANPGPHLDAGRLDERQQPFVLGRMHRHGVFHDDPRDGVRLIIQAGRVRKHATINVECFFVGEALVRVPVGRHSEGLATVTVRTGRWQAWLASLVAAGDLHGYRGTNAGPHSVIATQCLVIVAAGRPWTLRHVVNRFDLRGSDVHVGGIVLDVIVRVWVLSLVIFAVIDVTFNTAGQDRRIGSSRGLVFDNHIAECVNCTLIVLFRTWGFF